MDYAHKQTDKMLKSVEWRIAREYAQASREVAMKLSLYLADYKQKDQMWAQWVKDGKKTQEEWNNWRTGQMAMGQRWEDMRQSLAEDMHHTNEIAGSIVNGHVPEVYALNHNYGTYEIESGLGIDTSYTLYDRQTVERLMRDDPQMLPPPGKRVSERIRDGLDVRWNKQQIQSAMMQSILQGESIGQIATRLATTVGEKNRAAALRNARTMTTGAQNAGRVDSYKRAQDMGIKMRQQWVATLDGRTRHEHRMLDGETAEVGEPFKVEGEEIRFPGDPAAPGYLVYNCRCTLIAALEGFENDLSDLSIRNADKLEGMSYEEWKNEKAGQAKEATQTDDATSEIVPVKTREEAYDVLGTMFESVERNLSKIDEEILCSNVMQLQTLNARFGAITPNNTGYITSSASGKAMGYTKGRFGPDPNGNFREETNLGLVAKYYKDRDLLISQESRSVASFWSMPCPDDKLDVYTVTHEYGHILELQISRSRTDYGKLQEQADKSPSYDQKRGVYKTAEKEAAREIWGEIVEIARNNNPDFSLTENLSKYGRTNYYEAFAETFANSQLGEPNELGVAMNRWLERQGY